MEFDENLNPIQPNQGENWNTQPPPQPDPTPITPSFEGQVNQTQPPQPDPLPTSPNNNPINQTPTPMPDFEQTPPPEPFEPIQPDPVKDSSHPKVVVGNNNIGLIVAIVVLAATAITAIVIGSNQQAPFTPSSTIAQGLTVVGFGEAYATPDVAKIDFAVKTESKDLAESQKNNSTLIATIKNELVRFNIDAKDIKTIRYNISPEYDYFPARQPRLRGYSTYHSLKITVRQLEDADTIVQTLGAAGITEISQVQFTVDDTMETQNEAREEAIAEAKEKATQLASLSGAKLGKILSIEESASQPNWPYPRALDGFGGGQAEVGLEEGSISITSTVTIIYSLK